MKKTETQRNEHGRERKNVRGTDIFPNRIGRNGKRNNSMVIRG